MDEGLEGRVFDLKAENFGPQRISGPLRDAQHYAGEGGFVASLPQLLRGMALAPIDDPIWHGRFNALSEEDYGIDRFGRLGPEGGAVVIHIHGV